jgi:hypothetical protein
MRGRFAAELVTAAGAVVILALGIALASAQQADRWLAAPAWQPVMPTSPPPGRGVCIMDGVMFASRDDGMCYAVDKDRTKIEMRSTAELVEPHNLIGRVPTSQVMRTCFMDDYGLNGAPSGKVVCCPFNQAQPVRSIDGKLWCAANLVAPTEP